MACLSHGEEFKLQTKMKGNGIYGKADLIKNGSWGLHDPFFPLKEELIPNSLYKFLNHIITTLCSRNNSGLNFSNIKELKELIFLFITWTNLHNQISY